MLIFVNYWNRGGLGGGDYRYCFFFFFCVKELRKMIKIIILVEGYE